VNRYNDRAAAITERRSQRRFPIVASVELVDTQTSARSRARTSDLSMSGCYIDTLNPFTVGATLYLRIHKADATLKTLACVRTHHRGSGMGLAFTDHGPEESAIIENWLSESSPADPDLFSG
jgi:hypothetical protein